MKKVILTKPGNASKEISKQLEKAGLSKDALLVWPAFTLLTRKLFSTGQT